ncbi:MAG: hypothetical protein KJ065_28120 [Anaerolineae bacterium]|nr:hypothetical protein [Anaerolineae bacterium]
MIRTTLLLPAPLHQQLVAVSRQQGRSLSELARDLLHRGLTDRQSEQRQRTYALLRQMRGGGTSLPETAHLSNDELVYGVSATADNV